MTEGINHKHRKQHIYLFVDVQMWIACRNIKCLQISLALALESPPYKNG